MLVKANDYSSIYVISLSNGAIDKRFSVPPIKSCKPVALGHPSTIIDFPTEGRAFDITREIHEDASTA